MTNVSSKKLDKKIKAKWLAALRSGKFHQTEGCLKEVINGQKAYCCLGVLCETMGASYKGSDDFPSQIVLNKAGLTQNQADKLAKMNDDSGDDFKQIAAYISRNL